MEGVQTVGERIGARLKRGDVQTIYARTAKYLKSLPRLISYRCRSVSSDGLWHSPEHPGGHALVRYNSGAHRESRSHSTRSNEGVRPRPHLLVRSHRPRRLAGPEARQANPNPR